MVRSDGFFTTSPHSLSETQAYHLLQIMFFKILTLLIKLKPNLMCLCGSKFKQFPIFV